MLWISLLLVRFRAGDICFDAWKPFLIPTCCVNVEETELAVAKLHRFELESS